MRPNNCCGIERTRKRHITALAKIGETPMENFLPNFANFDIAKSSELRLFRFQVGKKCAKLKSIFFPCFRTEEKWQG